MAYTYDSNGNMISEGASGGDLNLHRYVGNNPLRFIDPLGLILPGDPDPTDEIIIGSWLWRQYGKKGFEIVKKIAKDVTIDGPQRGGRVCQIRYRKQPVLRIDYDAYPGTRGERRLHGHLPKIWPNLHIPLDPRSIKDE